MSTLSTRITRAFRRRGPAARQVYATARRVTRFFKDAPRRSALARLPATDLVLPADAGFIILPPAQFEETPTVVADARAALARFDSSAPPAGKRKKRFLQNVLDASTLTLDSAVIRFALRDDVLAMVSKYLGVVPLLSTITVFHSDTSEGAPTSSQLYHCDGDDITQVKIFVYCTDVTPASGPLTVLDARKTRQLQERTGYQFRDRLSDEKVRKIIGDATGHPILGPSGTTAFVDTSRCFHFGSRVAPAAPPRLATMIQYQTPYSFVIAADGEESLPFRRLLTGSLTPLQRLVLGE
ncbi:MAG: hypothetical protein FJW14_17250 [Acidimicrobiia bacterium]|nr:hypothetical protein [Acidimicrobiia bacterium]